ncbi:MAG: hypothetical protein KME54_29505 [Tolypothrix brevis GSE-NOS-MK-07-07A]|nr:hypothetical protein [Tolypothrix brevis GSE-NOS-MK-07-07A]
MTTNAVNSQNTSETPQEVVPIVNYGKEIPGIIQSYSENEILVNPNQGAVPLAIASPIANVPIFNQTVVRNPVNLELFDQKTPADGNIVNVILNGQIIRSNLPLTNTTQAVPLPLNAGTNTIQIAVVSTGAISTNTICFQVGATQTVENVVSGNCVSIPAGQQFVTTFGFPQIAFCLTNPIRFPCTTQAYPESVQHILEAKGIPPQPIAQPIKPNRSGNQVPSAGYPLLLTIDRPGANSRRNASTSSYLPCPPGIQDLDEYPPSVVLENAGSAHIKCIIRGDNRGSGQSLGIQINYYKITPGGISQPRLDDGDIIEIQALQ